MGAKGQPKTPGSGKKKGTLNKSSLAVKEKAELLGIDPIAVLLYFAAGRWRELGYESERPVIGINPDGSSIYGHPYITADHRLKAAGDVSKYIAPTLKAIEHTGADGGPIETEVIYDTAWRDAPTPNKEDA